MASDNYNDMAELVDNVRQLKNQQEELLTAHKEQITALNNQQVGFFNTQQGKIADFLKEERGNTGAIIAEQKKILTELKQEKYKTYSKYFFVGGCCFFLGAALATIVTFSISNWFNKELITTRNEIKIEKETLTKELEAINKVKGNYKKFDKYIDLLNILEKNNATIFTAKQFVKKTLLKDTEEQVVGIYFPMKALSNCGNGDSCYIQNDTNHAYNYS